MASVGLILNPEQKVFDSNGAIDQSATINFYTSGASSVRQKVYYDKEGEVAQGNPLDYSDLNGGAVIYGSPSITYRQVTVSGTGSTLFTVDNVNPIMPREQLSSNMDVSTYSIVSDSGINIPLTPSGTGQVVLDGLYFPNQDGAANQVLKTRGNGCLYWGDNSLTLSVDMSPQLGGALDGNGYSIRIDGESGIQDQNNNPTLYFTTTANAVNYINVTNSATGNAPQISPAGSDSNITLKLQGKGAGGIKINNILYPVADGTAGHALITNGLGVVSFAVPPNKFLGSTTSLTASVLGISGNLSWADTAPLSTEGTAIANITVTPTASNSFLRISISGPIWCTTGPGQLWIALFSTNSAGAPAVAVAASAVPNSTSDEIHLEFITPSATTASRTYYLRGQVGSGDTVRWRSSLATPVEYNGMITVSEFFT